MRSACLVSSSWMVNGGQDSVARSKDWCILLRTVVVVYKPLMARASFRRLLGQTPGFVIALDVRGSHSASLKVTRFTPYVLLGGWDHVLNSALPLLQSRLDLFRRSHILLFISLRCSTGSTESIDLWQKRVLQVVFPVHGWPG